MQEDTKLLLIADDNESIHDILGAALRGDDFDLIHAYDGRETLELAKEQLPDLIILDILMPLVDGWDVCMELKSNPDTKHIKIIMLTGKGGQLDRALGLDVGADDYVAKPFSLEHLCHKIRRALQKE